MGTNYFWRHNLCDCCGRYDEWHICKSMTSFQAYFACPEWNETARQYDPEMPLVVSWAKWKVLLRSGGQVWDEYACQHDVEEFISDVEAVSPERRRRQYDWVREHPIGYGRANLIDKVVPGGEWLDADGFSFYGGEFS